jgi:tripartite-type tricarboxylate transporter receptor subunit TctC
MSTRRAFLQQGPSLAAWSLAGLPLAPAVAATAPVSPAATLALGFPRRTVRIFTPFPAGSGPDAALRLVAEQLAQRWQQAVVVDNRPGGSGFIAVGALQRGARDGHDLLQLDSTHTTTHPSAFARLPYDVQADFAPLRMLLRTPFFFVVGADSPYRTLDDLIDAARARSGDLSYGSWFNGCPGHIGALLLESQHRLRMLHVPFRDFGQLFASVSTGEVDWTMGTVATAAPMVAAGRIRLLTLAANQREPLYPAVPTTAESARTRGFELSAWAGLFGPASIAGALQNAIAQDISHALAAPAVRANYRSLGYDTPPLAPAAFDALIRSETRQWVGVIAAAGLMLD